MTMKLISKIFKSNKSRVQTSEVSTDLHEARLSPVATAFPPHKCTAEQFKGLTETIANIHLADKMSSEELEKFVSWQKRVIDSSGIDERSFVVDMTGEGNEVPTMSDGSNIFLENNYNPSRHLRAAVYREGASKLAFEAATKAIQNWGGDLSGITHVVTVTNTGWSLPGLGANVIDQLGLASTTSKYDLTYNGCYAGMTALRLARDTYKANKKAAILVVACEISSVHHNPFETDKAKVIGNLIMGDGAAATVVSSTGDWKMEDFGTYQVPNSIHAIQAHEADPSDNPDDQTTHQMQLAKELPTVLGSTLTGAFGRNLVKRILGRCGLTGQRPAFCVHGGGKRILENVQTAADKLKLGKVVDENYEVMANHGNMETVSLLAVMAKYLPKSDRKHICLMAFGPGVTVEHGFLRRV